LKALRVQNAKAVCSPALMAIKDLRAGGNEMSEIASRAATVTGAGSGIVAVNTQLSEKIGATRPERALPL
jgi:hypothetical protein